MTMGVRLLRWIGAGFALLVALSGLAAVGGTLYVFVMIQELPRVPEPLRRIIETPPTELFAANGEQIMELGGREYVTLDQVAFTFIQAILATEDHRFWEHRGLNKMRTLKVLWTNLCSRGRAQGASTITQQLAKNLFFSFEQTYTRKLRELLVSLQIESQFSKQDILEAYANQIYFGPGAQGVGAASRFFFGKPAIQLNLAEAALLAGLPKSPTRYNPLRHYDRAKARQGVVLGRMVAAGFISAEEAQAATAQELQFKQDRPGEIVGSYFVDWVLKTLEDRYNPQIVYHGGLKVTTTLDPLLQYEAEKAVQEGLTNLEKLMPPNKVSPPAETPDILQGALVAVQVNSGAVKALVGGRDYAVTEFNRAVENNRLPGSGFKPFLYYTAFEKLGLSPASIVVDQPIRLPVAGAPDWSPRNFEREFQGPVMLKAAFTESINTVAAQLVAQVGPQAVIETAHRCGVTSALAPVYSVALGTSGVSPLEMASAFTTFASGGIHYPAFGIWRVEDAHGRVLEEHLVSGRRVLDPRMTFQIVDMMQGVVDEGTGRNLRKLGFIKPAAGKTGTTNGYKDAWFTGFTPTLAASVWVGFDRDIGLKDAFRVGITGAKGAIPIWAAFMNKATEGEPARPFTQPSGIRMVPCDRKTGQPADGNDPEAVWAALLTTSQSGSISQPKVRP
jgi:penicillin-binding protein 1A